MIIYFNYLNNKYNLEKIDPKLKSLLNLRNIFRCILIIFTVFYVLDIDRNVVNIPNVFVLLLNDLPLTINILNSYVYKYFCFNRNIRTFSSSYLYIFLI